MVAAHRKCKPENWFPFPLHYERKVSSCSRTQQNYPALRPASQKPGNFLGPYSHSKILNLAITELLLLTYS